MPGETSCGKSTIEQILSGSRSATPRTTAALARMWPLPMALERIRISAPCPVEVTGGIILGGTSQQTIRGRARTPGSEDQCDPACLPVHHRGAQPDAFLALCPKTPCYGPR